MIRKEPRDPSAGRTKPQEPTASEQPSLQIAMAGVEMLPPKQYQSALNDYLAAQIGAAQSGDPRAAEMEPPQPALPIFADRDGNFYMMLPADDKPQVLPYIPGSPMSLDPEGFEKGGFVAMDKLPPAENAGSGGGATPDMLAGLMGGMPLALGQNWLAGMMGSLIPGAAGNPLTGAMQMLGLGGGSLSGQAAGAFAQAAGGMIGGPAGGLLPAFGHLLGGAGPGAFGAALGSQGMGALLGSAGLGHVPATGFVGPMAGAQLSSALTEGLCGMMGGAGGGLGCVAEIPWDVPEGAMPGCFPQGQESGFSVDDIAPAALNAAGDHLLSQWQVDDESSAAEHIAHKAVNDHKAQILAAGGDPDGALAQLKAFFTGQTSSADLPCARQTDPDDAADKIAVGVATILVESLPIARLGDPLVPSGKKILTGEPSVLAAGEPLAHVASATEIPTLIDAGAAQVLVAGTPAVIAPPDSAADPDAACNAAPAAPEAPADACADADSGADPGDGTTASSESADSMPSERGDAPSALDGPDDQESGFDSPPEPFREEPSRETDLELDRLEDPNLGSDDGRIGTDSGTDSPEDGKQHVQALSAETSITDSTDGGQVSRTGEPSLSSKSDSEADSSRPNSLEELLGLEPEEPNQTYWDRVQIEDRPIAGGLASHSYIAVYKDGERVTYSGRNRNFPDPGPLGVERNYDLDYSNQPSWSYIVPPPEGMSHSQWVDSVIGAGENAVWNDSTRDYSWYGGDGGIESGNCHVAAGNILSDAAGSPVILPDGQHPPRFAPGFPVAPPPPPPSVVDD